MFFFLHFLATVVITASGPIPQSGSTPTPTPASFTDNFNRTENPLTKAGTWTKYSGGDTLKTDGTYVLGANQASNDCIYYVNTPTFSANQKSTITISDAGTGDVSAGVRLNSNGTGYIAYLTPALNVVQVLKPPTFSQVGADVSITAVTTGDTIGISASGTGTVTLTVFRNNVSQTTRTDSSSPVNSGQPGIHIFDDSNSKKIDNFQADDL